LNHASLIDGRRLAQAPLAVYHHCDAAHVDELLRESTAARAVVVSESVFSMDGDVAPLDDLLEVCAQWGALLVLDEAHAVLGPSLDPECAPDVDVLRVGTLSKTMGALGGFVTGSERYTQLLVNRARSYIFTTASSPADAAAALAALRVVRSPEGDALRTRLRANIDLLVPGHPSPVIPYICGSEARALAVAAALLDLGLLVTAIRPPTVPPGTSRLRVTVSAAHAPAQVEVLAEALRMLFPERG
jgi:7-keto-8-aminopelargonate synthetase-like enzyme